MNAALVVVAYDSPNDKRRRKIAQLLDDVADRVQWSVFEGRLTSEQIEQTWRRVQAVANATEDKIRLYRLCTYCCDAARVAGGGALTQLPEYWIV
jgi:CRISPR-associated protein Cas2